MVSRCIGFLIPSIAMFNLNACKYETSYYAFEDDNNECTFKKNKKEKNKMQTLSKPPNDDL